MVSGLAGTHTLRVIAELPFGRGRVVPIFRIVIFGGVFALLNDGLFSRWVNYSLQPKHDCHEDNSSTKPSIVVEGDPAGLHFGDKIELFRKAMVMYTEQSMAVYHRTPSQPCGKHRLSSISDAYGVSHY